MERDEQRGGDGSDRKRGRLIWESQADFFLPKEKNLNHVLSSFRIIVVC